MVISIVLMVSFFMHVQSTVIFTLPSFNSNQHEFIQYHINTDILGVYYRIDFLERIKRYTSSRKFLEMNLNS